MQNIKVSIIIPTYNHEIFINKAIESAIYQNVNFNIEIIIGDDCSTDGTIDIIKQFKEKYPDLISYFSNEQNIGVFNMVKKLYYKCKGKYVAVIEGDDHWTYKNKLQEQVDFLENNSEYIACFHDAKIISSNPDNTDNILYKNQYFKGHKKYSTFNKYYSDFLPEHLINRNIIPTASLVFRHIDLSGFIQNFTDITLSLNWAVHLYIIQNSKFKYFNEQWSVYNDHPGGISKNKNYNEFILSNIKVLKRFIKLKTFNNLKQEMYKSLRKEYFYLYHTTKNNSFPFKAIKGYIYYYFAYYFHKLFLR